MKRILPRFVRCFLIAALAAAVVGPIAPAGAAIGESIVCGRPPGLAPPELTVSPSWSVVPGEWITVVGSGFTDNARVILALEGGSAAVVVAGEGAADHTPAVSANAHGTFIYRGRVPFDDEVTATPGKKTWTATDQCGRAARSSDFTIAERTISMLSPASPGATVTVSGRGWGYHPFHYRRSRVAITLEDGQGHPIPNVIFGPFPVNHLGLFDGRITVPPYARGEIRVVATDNNGRRESGGTGGFSANQTATAALRVTPGVVSVASTGVVITITGTGFPAQTNLSSLMFGQRSELPVPAPATDVNGNIVVHTGVPASYGHTLGDRVAVCMTVADVVGCTEFTIPSPFISLSTATARPGDVITITGTGFSAYANVDTINIGQVPALPVPNPRTNDVGAFIAAVTVPPLKHGGYTVRVRTGPFYTYGAPIRILRPTVGSTVPAETAFRALTSRGLLTLAAAASPGGTSFGAYVPGLPGDTLTHIEPEGVLILTLAEDARISVSGQSPVDVAADTPTLFHLGPEVSVEVIEHGA